MIRTKEGEVLVGVARIDEPAAEADLFDDEDQSAAADGEAGRTAGY